MSTDNGGIVRGSMMFNPQVAYPIGYYYSNNPYLRLFQKSSSITPGRLFGIDTQTGFSADTFAHYPSTGFNVLFTDGSVQFVQNITASMMVIYGVPVGAPGDGRNAPAYKSGIANNNLQYSWLYGCLEGTPPEGIAWSGDGGQNPF
jgi:prepilin-type processing-associated H-X9-DG protein